MELVGLPSSSEVEQYEAGSEFKKIWKVKNSGNEAWSRGTVLMHFSGDLVGDKVFVPALEPGEIADIEAMIRVPEKEGKYIAEWTLATPLGVKFGNKLTVAVQAVMTNQEFQKNLNALLTLGFPEDEARKALEKHPDDINEAVLEIIQNLA